MEYGIGVGADGVIVVQLKLEQFSGEWLEVAKKLMVLQCTKWES